MRRLGGILFSLWILSSVCGFAGRATAPYVEGELLIAVERSSVRGEELGKSIFGKSVSLNKLLEVGLLDDKAKTFLAKAGVRHIEAAGVVCLMREPLRAFLRKRADGSVHGKRRPPRRLRRRGDTIHRQLEEHRGGYATAFGD